MDKLIIRREEWLRGIGYDRSRLLEKDTGKRCCLGILGRELGYTDEELEDQTDPTYVAQINNKWPDWLLMNGKYNSLISRYLMQINDDEKLEESEREAEIEEIFRNNGIEVEFR